MSQHFQNIGLVGKPNHEGANSTLTALHHFLTAKNLSVFVEYRTAEQLSDIEGLQTLDLVELGRTCDLAIVVGGDGNMLGAARVLSRFNIGVIGVNRGNLGFLTDLSPDSFEESLSQVLNGEFITEKRFLLEVEVYRHERLKSSNSAMNEAVIHSDKVAHMIEFEAYIDDAFVFSQRSDGLIVSTPTGTTAYSLSGGGPIVNPNLEAISLVPMFPHTLSSRPLVVDANSQVTLRVSDSNDAHLQVSCDSHVVLPVIPGDEIQIKKSPFALRLLHPKNYNYFEVLRNKLGWGSRLF